MTEDTKIFKAILEGKCADSLCTISEVNFTPRQIDILSCLICGRDTKAISNLLSISARTVETHIENIKLRKGLHSRQQLINFIEVSQKAPLLRCHYSFLNLFISFNTSLDRIAKNLQYRSNIVFVTVTNDKWPPPAIFLSDHILNHLKEISLKIFELTLSENSSQQKISTTSKKFVFYIPLGYCNLIQTEALKYIRTFSQSNEIPSSDIYILSLMSEVPKTHLNNTDEFEYTFRFKPNAQYFASFFRLLTKLYIDTIIQNELDKFVSLYTNANLDSTFKPLDKHITLRNQKKSHSTDQTSLQLRIVKESTYLLGTVIALSIFFILGWGVSYLFNSTTYKGSIQATDSTYETSSILKRDHLLKEIDNKFKVSDSGIKYVVLLGIGGAGKTTLAEQYALLRPAGVSWKINAESEQRLLDSFKRLATLIASETKQQNLLDQILAMQDKDRRKKFLIQLIQNFLKDNPEWLLIYDNVNNLMDIDTCFPHDSTSWGKGRVLITTRNQHLSEDKVLNASAFIEVTQLSKEEAYDLFVGNFFSNPSKAPAKEMKAEIYKFISFLPPFPLDISTAATYLRVTNTSFSKYLKKLNELNKEFSDFQIRVRRENSEYQSTRYAIIANAIESVVNENPHFKNVLLFISLLDSQEIPIILLEKFIGEITIDKFIYALQKNSLILANDAKIQERDTISFHRSIHAILLQYFKQTGAFQNKKALIDRFLLTMEDNIAPALQHESLDQIFQLVPHYERIVSHAGILLSHNLEALEATLACMYFYTKKGNDKISRKLLEKFDINKNRMDPLFHKHVLRNMMYLGLTYIYSDNSDIKNFTDRIIREYKKDLQQNSELAAWALCYIGRMYYIIGEYETSKDLLEKSYALYKSGTSGDLIGYARTLSFLGNVYWRIGDYKNSEKLLKQALHIFDEQLSSEHYERGWCLQALGHFYEQMGIYETARSYFEQSIKVYKKFFPDNQMRLNWPTSGLGNVLVDLGEIPEAILILETALESYEKNLDPMHREIGWVCLYLGRAYFENGELAKSTKLLSRAESIFIESLGHEHLRLAYLNHIIADIDIHQEKYDDAEKRLLKTVRILSNYNHPLEYRSLELLSEIYKKKAQKAIDSNQYAVYETFIRQQHNSLEKAYAIITPVVIANSPHPQRIEQKLKSIRQNSYTKSSLNLTN